MMNKHKRRGKLFGGLGVTLIALTIAPATSSAAIVYDWTSTSGGAWNDSGNWAPRNVPGTYPVAGDDAMFEDIDAGTVTGNGAAGRLVVGSGWGITSGTRSASATFTGTLTLDVLNVGHDAIEDGLDDDVVTGVMTIGSTGQVSSNSAAIGWNTQATGTLTIEGQLTNANHFQVGQNGGDGTVNVSGSGQLTVGAADFGSGQVWSGTYGLGTPGTGLLNVEENATLTVNGWNPENPVNRLAIGLRNGDGTANIDGTVSVATGTMYVGWYWPEKSADATGLVTVGHNANIDAASLVLSGTSTMVHELGSSGDVGDFDMTGGMTVDGILKLELLEEEELGGTYTLYAFASSTGTFDSVYYDGELISNPTEWNLFGDTGTYAKLYYNSGNIELVVPEPTTLLLILAGPVVATLRRRRQA